MVCSDDKRRALADELFAVLLKYKDGLCSDCVSGALVQIAAMAMADSRPGDADAVMTQAEDRCELLMECVSDRLVWLVNNPPGPSEARH